MTDDPQEISGLPDKLRDEKGRYSKLNREARWALIIETIMGSPQVNTMQAVADKLGVGRTTLYRDMDDPEFPAFKDRLIKHIVSSNLLLHAWKNITRAVIKDNDVKVSQWLIEHCRSAIPTSASEEIIEGEFVELTSSTNGESPEIINLMNELKRRLGEN